MMRLSVDRRFSDGKGIEGKANYSTGHGDGLVGSQSFVRECAYHTYFRGTEDSGLT